jgi:hypothetical protein
MTRRATVQIVAAIVIAVFAVGIWSSQGTLDASWLRFYSAAVIVAVAALGLWDRWLWRMAPAQRMNGVPRDLRGTWAGTLSSGWVDPSTGRSRSPAPVYLVVRQTATEVRTKLLASESRSSSSALAAVLQVGDEVTLQYLYFSQPDSKFAQKSRPHRGSTVLSASGLPARRLRGEYWTDRDSKGEIDLTERVKRYADDFDEAEAFFK